MLLIGLRNLLIECVWGDLEVVCGLILEESDRVRLEHLDISSEIKNPGCLSGIATDCRVIHGLYDLSIH